ncbi:MAG TPA: type II 3-dehydroquinate dehydratase [Chitinophagaceae bacterium]|nr:type II 3-dehydroquinate dehydratase [Chitinophagaceae bacterium]
MNISIINGPNLNLLGTREPEVYGAMTFPAYLTHLNQVFPGINLTYFQSNIEGEIINELQRVGSDHQGILLNAGGYTHTSVAIRDAVAAIKAPVIEIHISNIFSREEFRHFSLIAPKCRGSICGLGLEGYELGIRYFSL